MSATSVALGASDLPYVSMAGTQPSRNLPSEFVDVRAACARLDRVIARVEARLPMVVRIPEPPTDLLKVHYAEPSLPRVRYSYVDWGRINPSWLGLGFGSAACGYVVALAGLHFPFLESMALGVLVGGGVAIVPNIGATLLNGVIALEQLVRNSRIRRKEAAAREAAALRESEVAPRRSDQLVAHQAWRAKMEALAERTANTITVASLQPLFDHLASIEPRMRDAVLGYASSFLERFVAERGAALTVGAAAEASCWRAEAKAASGRPLRAAMLLGVLADHFDPTSTRLRKGARDALSTLPAEERRAIAAALQARYYSADACVAPGDRCGQIETLRMLRGAQQ